MQCPKKITFAETKTKTLVWKQKMATYCRLWCSLHIRIHFLRVPTFKLGKITNKFPQFTRTENYLLRTLWELRTSLLMHEWWNFPFTEYIPCCDVLIVISFVEIVLVTNSLNRKYRYNHVIRFGFPSFSLSTPKCSTHLRWGRKVRINPVQSAQGTCCWWTESSIMKLTCFDCRIVCCQGNWGKNPPPPPRY